MNIIIVALFSFIPSLIAYKRKIVNRKRIFIINAIVGLINIYMSFNIMDSLAGMGFGGFGIISVLVFIGWLYCLIAAIAGKKE